MVYKITVDNEVYYSVVGFNRVLNKEIKVRSSCINATEVLFVEPSVTRFAERNR